MRTVEREESLIEFFLTILLVASLNETITFCDEVLGLGKVLGGQLALYAHEALHQRLVLLEHLIVALGNGTRNDKRCTGIVDQHGVDLVDDSVVMGTLHEVGRRDGHVVTQVVEAELIVRSEGDICLIRLTTGLGVRLVLVDTIYTETMEHIEWSHPFGVTLGEVVVDGHHVDSVAGEGIEEYGEGGHEGLTFTRCHLGNLSLMEYDTTEELHIIVDHLPGQVVASGSPVIVVDSLVAVDGDEVFFGVGSQFTVKVCGGHHGLFVLSEAPGGLLDNGEHLRHHLVEGLLIDVEYLFLYLVNLCEDVSTFIDGGVLDGGFQLSNTCPLLCGCSLNLFADLLGTGTESIVVQLLYLRRYCLHLLYERLDEFHVAGGLVTKQRLKNLVEIHDNMFNLIIYNL